MNRLRSLVSLAVAFVLLFFVSACASSQPTMSPSSTVAKPTESTAGQLAESGKTTFANRCARCHGDNGQGATAPAVIGPDAALGKYNTAQGLLDFVDTTMPMNAPGSLSRQEYLQVLCFLLVQNQFVPADTVFDPNSLGSLSLKK
jgi:mono/diheme cytochrome c family protein